MGHNHQRRREPLHLSRPQCLKDKENQKEIRFDESLKKNPSWGLNAPFRFDILAQLANILASITLHELLCLSKKMIEALRDSLADSESFDTSAFNPYRGW